MLFQYSRKNGKEHSEEHLQLDDFLNCKWEFNWLKIIFLDAKTVFIIRNVKFLPGARALQVSHGGNSPGPRHFQSFSVKISSDACFALLVRDKKQVL